MAQLINCIECNKPVSSNAEKCPHCGIRSFHGSTCVICNGVSKFSDMLFLSYNGQYGGSFTAHPTCYVVDVPQDSKVTVKLNCPVCNNYSTTIKWRPSRRDCYVNKLDIKKCVYSSDHDLWTMVNQTYQNIDIFDSSHPDGFSQNYYHPKCPNCGNSQLTASGMKSGWGMSRDEDPYASCYICNQVLSKNRSYIGRSWKNHPVYIHRGICQSRYEKDRAKDNLKKINKTLIDVGIISLSIGFAVLGVFIFLKHLGWWLWGIACFVIAHQIWKIKFPD